MSCCYRIISSIDFLSPRMGFEYEGSTNYKCISGGIYSSLIIIVNIIMTITFSLKFYSRLDSNVLSYQIDTETSTIWLDNFPMVITISNTYSLKPEYYDYFKLEIISFDINKNGTFTRKLYNNILEKYKSTIFNQNTQSNNFKVNLHLE